MALVPHWFPHLALALLVAAAPTAAFAQAGGGEQDARYHFRLGQAHYESGHFLDAAHEFEESYRLSQRPELLHNIYVAYRDAGDHAHAADALERYLREVPDVENRALLERRLAVLRRIQSQSAATPEETTDATAAADPAVEPTAEATEPESVGTSTSSASTTTSTSGTDDGGDGGGLSPIGFIVGGVGAAALIGGAITGGLALSQEGDLAAMCPDDMCPPNVDVEGMADSGRTLALVTDILIPVGVVALAAGVVLILVLRDGGGDEDTAVGAACGPDGCMAALRTAF